MQNCLKSQGKWQCYFMSINELFFHNTVGTDTVAVSKYMASTIKKI